MVAGNYDGHVYLFNKIGELLWKYKTDGEVYSVSITSDGEYVVAGSEYYDSNNERSYGYIYLFNKRGELLWKYETDDDVNSVSITPDGEYVVAGSSDDHVYLFASPQAMLILEIKNQIKQCKNEIEEYENQIKQHKNLIKQHKNQIKQNTTLTFILILIQVILIQILKWDWRSPVVIVISLATIYYIIKIPYLLIKIKKLEREILEREKRIIIKELKKLID